MKKLIWTLMILIAASTLTAPAAQAAIKVQTTAYYQCGSSACPAYANLFGEFLDTGAMKEMAKAVADEDLEQKCNVRGLNLAHSRITRSKGSWTSGYVSIFQMNITVEGACN